VHTPPTTTELAQELLPAINSLRSLLIDLVSKGTPYAPQATQIDDGLSAVVERLQQAVLNDTRRP